MIVVSDASPLNSPVLLGTHHVLPALSGQLIATVDRIEQTIRITFDFSSVASFFDELGTQRLIPFVFPTGEVIVQSIDYVRSAPDCGTFEFFAFLGCTRPLLRMAAGID